MVHPAPESLVDVPAELTRRINSAKPSRTRNVASNNMSTSCHGGVTLFKHLQSKADYIIGVSVFSVGYGRSHSQRL